MRTYNASSSHTIICPADLSYAVTGTDIVKLDAITPDDFKKVNLIADPLWAAAFNAAMESSNLPSPAEIMSSAAEPDPNWRRNTCIIQNDVIYIRNDASYDPLEKLIKSSDKDTLAVALRFAAYQAAVNRAELLTLKAYINHLPEEK